MLDAKQAADSLGFCVFVMWLLNSVCVKHDNRLMGKTDTFTDGEGMKEKDRERE